MTYNVFSGTLNPAQLISSFFLSSFFSSPNVSGRRLDVYHNTAHGVALVRIECRSEMCCMRLAGNAGPKNRQKFAI